MQLHLLMTNRLSPYPHKFLSSFIIAHLHFDMHNTLSNKFCDLIMQHAKK